MCLLHISEFLPGNAGALFSFFVKSIDLIKHSLIPCQWQKACEAPSIHTTIPAIPSTAESERELSPLRSQGILCPYLEVRHDADCPPTNLKRENYERVMMDGINLDHGCDECWYVVSDYDFVRRMPNPTEKAHYLKRIGEVPPNEGEYETTRQSTDRDQIMTAQDFEESDGELDVDLDSDSNAAVGCPP
jgi:hypothetical protein